jgi:hypothetical protein
MIRGSEESFAMLSLTRVYVSLVDSRQKTDEARLDFPLHAENFDPQFVSSKASSLSNTMGNTRLVVIISSR